MTEEIHVRGRRGTVSESDKTSSGGENEGGVGVCGWVGLSGKWHISRSERGSVTEGREENIRTLASEGFHYWILNSEGRGPPPGSTRKHWGLLGNLDVLLLGQMDSLWPLSMALCCWLKGRFRMIQDESTAQNLLLVCYYTGSDEANFHTVRWNHYMQLKAEIWGTIFFSNRKKYIHTKPFLLLDVMVWKTRHVLE